MTEEVATTNALKFGLGDIVVVKCSVYRLGTKNEKYNSQEGRITRIPKGPQGKKFRICFLAAELLDEEKDFDECNLECKDPMH